MKLSHFFIDRPVFAAVVAILITLVGVIAYPSLPVAQYPEIAPPTVTVNATYPGASAETVAEQVATPIEQQINGVQDMLYMSSQSTGDGHMTITVTFKLGTDINIAQVLVQNRVATALPLLPQEIQATGVVVRQSSPDLLLAIHLYSPDRSLDPQYIANYATLQIHDDLLRLPGVGDISTRGARDYSMRIWIDPDKAAARSLTVDDIVGALRSHNVQVAAGALNQPPFGPNGGSYQLNVQTKGLLTEPSEFANIIVKTDAQGRYTRISDVARVELGAQDYTTSAYLNDNPAVALIMFEQPGANALKTADEIQAEMKRLSARFPPGLAYRIIYNPTEYIHASITEVQKTLIEALILVVVVVIVFLQTWRAAIIPILAIPVSLIGTLAVMKVAGFSVNTLTMFGLVLAIGIVVDDAIVVVENIERHLRAGVSPREAAHITMDEVGGALIAICLVLVGVFVPAAFITGITGQFFRQFALTIASATVVSLIVSLTLSPAVAALIMKPHRHDQHLKSGWARRLVQRAADGFNDNFDRLSGGYSDRVRRLVRIVGPMLVIYVGLLLLTGWRLADTPTGFIPQQDQGNVLALISLPAGANLAQTDAVTRRALKLALRTPGVLAAGANVGVDAATNTTAPNAAQMYVVLQSFEYREKHHQTLASITADMQKRFGAITDADLRVINPAPVRGIGTSGGFKMIVEDRSGADYADLEHAANAVLAEGSKQPAVRNAFVTYNTKTPRLYADIDRDKAEVLGVPNSAVFDTLQTYLGSTFVNDFTLFGHTYQVLAQADWPFRNDESKIPQLQTRSNSGAMAPLGAFVTLKRTTGPYRVLRYNLYPAAEVQGDTSPGHSSGQSIKAMEQVAARVLPANFSYEWTELAYQQQAAGSSGYLVFVLAVVFAFLLLAALYESVTLPFAVILIVPMCILAAITGVNIRGLDNNILTQVGLVVLIGLAAKNAILIVEFARQGEIEHGLGREDAAAGAARTRLRPILMTSFAFILGVTPLAFGSGAGSEMSHALGVSVFFGMIGVTLFGLVFTPVFYMFFRRVADRLPKPPPPPPPMPTTGSPHTGHELELVP